MINSCLNGDTAKTNWTFVNNKPRNHFRSFNLLRLFGLESYLEAIICYRLLSGDHWLIVLISSNLTENNWVFHLFSIFNINPKVFNHGISGDVMMTIIWTYPVTSLSDKITDGFKSVSGIKIRPFLNLDFKTVFSDIKDSDS